VSDRWCLSARRFRLNMPVLYGTSTRESVVSNRLSTQTLQLMLCQCAASCADNTAEVQPHCIHLTGTWPKRTALLQSLHCSPAIETRAHARIGRFGEHINASRATLIKLAHIGFHRRRESNHIAVITSPSLHRRNCPIRSLMRVNAVQRSQPLSPIQGTRRIKTFRGS
jgi:hypothetical protein